MGTMLALLASLVWLGGQVVGAQGPVCQSLTVSTELV